MPVVPTYPGVYIEEIPSGVHTITGVATSIAAFIGYTEQGPVDEAVHIFSFADYERAFGGLTVDSPLSYAVQQFFTNGGTEAYVVRVASGATSATLTLAWWDETLGQPNPAVDVTAASDGTWGNFVQLDVDYNTINPDSLFNLRVTQYVNQNGRMVPGLVETYRNLSMSNMSPNYFLPAINGASQLISVALHLGLSFTQPGYSQSGVLPSTLTSLDLNHNRVAVSVDGGAPLEFDFFSAPLGTPPPGGTLLLLLGLVKTALQTALDAAFGHGATVVAHTATNLTVTSSTTGQNSAVRFINAGSNDACQILMLGVANGGIEVEGAANRRPVVNGDVGGALPSPFPVLPAPAAINIDVLQAGSTTPLNGGTPITLSLWSATAPTNVNDLLTAMRAAFNTLAGVSANNQAYLRGTTVEADAILGFTHLRIVPGLAQGNIYFKISDTGDNAANSLLLTTTVPPPPLSANFGHYVLGSGSGDANVPTVAAASPGANGTTPAAVSDFGDPLAKTGMYSLDAVDIFNIMCLPDVADILSLAALYPQAVAYCQLRRAMLIVDLPATYVTITQAQNWLTGTGATILDSHAAAYFPRMMAADPLRNGNVHQFPNCGAIAGIWARTDAQRGVWKAPAGIEGQIIGAVGLTNRMNNQENGVLNPLGLNCLRTFPVFGNVVWGARTMRGADALTDDYKYVPVRRLALFLEESLYRGTQWVVFEPNDEPLWAQIRLTVGSFMHSLFRQGAFAGQTPREAYFVKCDKETTTPLDQDQGRVNIIVGFAPLFPSEFVIIQIQQIVSVGPT
jgi:Bacteriophage tail sheath protein